MPLVGRSARKGTFTILRLVCAEGVPSGDAAEYNESRQVEALCQVLRRAVHRIPSLGAEAPSLAIPRLWLPRCRSSGTAGVVLFGCDFEARTSNFRWSGP